MPKKIVPIQVMTDAIRDEMTAYSESVGISKKAPSIMMNDEANTIVTIIAMIVLGIFIISFTFPLSRID